MAAASSSAPTAAHSSPTPSPTIDSSPPSHQLLIGPEHTVSIVEWCEEDSNVYAEQATERKNRGENTKEWARTCYRTRCMVHWVYWTTDQYMGESVHPCEPASSILDTKTPSTIPGSIFTNTPRQCLHEHSTRGLYRARRSVFTNLGSGTPHCRPSCSRSLSGMLQLPCTSPSTTFVWMP